MCSRRRSQLGHSVWRKFGAPAVFLAFGVLAAVPALSRAEDSCDSFLSCCDQGGNCRQFYLGGIVGADFATVNKTANGTAVPNDSIFTAGGTAGMRMFRDNGALRVEFEGRGRDRASLGVQDAQIGEIRTSATDGWSAMVNAWRDYKPFEKLGFYGGGGIGCGGYHAAIDYSGSFPVTFSGDDRIANFAWQAGAGVIYDVSNRMSVDLGYRFFSIVDSTATASTATATGPIGSFDYTTNFAAGELLLQVRIYEPFRGWRR
jgi:outer membrane immunogenic protein